MSQSAPGKHYRQGMSLKALFRKFPNDETAETLVCRDTLAERDRLPLLRLSECADRQPAQDDAVPLPGEGVREAVQRADRDGDAVQQARLPDLGDCDLT